MTDPNVYREMNCNLAAWNIKARDVIRCDDIQTSQVNLNTDLVAVESKTQNQSATNQVTTITNYLETYWFKPDYEYINLTPATYTAGTYYTLGSPDLLALAGSTTHPGVSFLAELLIVYDSFWYHSWIGSCIISTTYWKNSGTLSTTTMNMSVHDANDTTAIIRVELGQNTREFKFTPGTTITVATGGKVVFRMKRLFGALL